MNVETRLPILLSLVLLLTSAALTAQSPSGGGLLFSGSGEEPLPRLSAKDSGGGTIALWDPDPLSSGWILNVNGTAVTPADDGWVRQSSETGTTRRITYSDRSIDITQDAVISGEGHHCRVTATITNSGSESAAVAPRLLLDTHLGEPNGLPFLLDDGTYPRSEASMEGSGVPAWIKTVRSEASPDLTVVLDGRIATRPDSVVLANWLRLKQEGGNYIAREGRSFDYLPFSESDSAMLLFWDEKELGPSESMEITVVFGLDENVPSPGEFDDIRKAAIDRDAENARLREYTIRQRLREIDVIVGAIDRLLENEGDLSDQAVVDVEGRVGRQERLRSEYENL